MTHPLPPSLIARLSAVQRDSGKRLGEGKVRRKARATVAPRPVRPRVDTALRRRTATRRETEKPLWNAGRLLNAMRELSKPDILSAMPGQVTGRWSLSPILSDDLHFAARPRVSLNVTVDGEKKKKRKELQDSENPAGEDFICPVPSETRRTGEKIGRGERVLRFRFVFILRIEREREKGREKFRS